MSNYANTPPLHERAHGRWFGILSHLGIAQSFLTKKNGPCPFCGGVDRWRWTDFGGHGSWICNNCGHGTGIDLVKLIFGKEFKEAAEIIESVIGKAEPEQRKERSEEELRAAMRSVWQAGNAVILTCPVGRYLINRCPGLTEYPKALRSAPGLRHGDRSFPAMIAQVVGPDGVAVNVHRTWLTADGRKAPVDPVRKLMPGALPGGSAVRLGRPVQGRLGVAEGLETALAASVLHGVPVWSVISAGNMQGFRPPAEVTELFIFGDNDVSMVGQAAAYSTARDIVRDCQRNNREITVKVLIPEKAGTDWADVLVEKSK
ncbi:MAG: toprim domain-containing protein [Rhodospirillaceae bacterium]